MRKIALLLLLPLLFAIGCSDDKDKKNIELKEDNTTLYHLDTYQINATSDTKITYISENEYHATVDKETGLVKAGKVGETDIALRNENDEKKFKVIVEPESELYVTPNVVWGTSKVDIIKEYGEPYSIDEEENIIVYVNEEDAQLLMFSFDEANKLLSSAVAVDASEDVINELAVFLNERYTIVTQAEEVYFINGLTEETATLVALASFVEGDITDFVLVMYAPIELLNARSNAITRSKIQFEETLNHLAR